MGDKTFFIAALLAARANKLLTFVGCAGALAVMTVISVGIGQVHRHRASASPRTEPPPSAGVPLGAAVAHARAAAR